MEGRRDYFQDWSKTSIPHWSIGSQLELWLADQNAAALLYGLKKQKGSFGPKKEERLPNRRSLQYWKLVTFSLTPFKINELIVISCKIFHAEICLFHTLFLKECEFIRKLFYTKIIVIFWVTEICWIICHLRGITAFPWQLRPSKRFQHKK